MILAVTERFHDYEPNSYYVDTDKLDPKNPVDALVLKKCKTKSKKLSVYIDATDWEDDDPGISGKAIFKKSPEKIDRALDLTIYFDC